MGVFNFIIMVSPVKPVSILVFLNCFCRVAMFCDCAGVLQIYNCASLGNDASTARLAAFTPVPDKDNSFNSFKVFKLPNLYP
jgi:hypothetical protein